MVLNIAGIVLLIVLYLTVLIVGIVAARKFKTDPATTSPVERNVVAGRNLSTVVGIFTMTATTVGGGFLNGTAESVAAYGIWWTLAPFGILFGLIIGGVMFAEKMRSKRYLTMLDPFQERYCDAVIALFYLAAISGDIFWSASVLSALGTSISVIVGISIPLSIGLSAVVAIIYTLFGQMIAVAYTDILQLIFIVFGLSLSVPFVMCDSRVGNFSATSAQWSGSPDTSSLTTWIDLLLAMTLGTIPWQSYFQRVLSMRTAKDAQLLSIFGGIGAFLLAIPPALIGVAAVSADWNQTQLGQSPLETGQSSLVLPLVLKHFTPNIVAIIGLGTISAAVMSSMDSAILGSSSMFTHNIYKAFLRKKASLFELVWIQRISVFIVGSISTVMAVFVPSIYGLFILAADFIYVVMFPQLVAVVYSPFRTNSYGALIGYATAVVLRLGAGEPYLLLPAFIPYPSFNESEQTEFPFRTFAMVVALIEIVVVSVATDYALKRLPPKFDILGAISDRTVTSRSTTSDRVQDQSPVSHCEQDQQLVPDCEQDQQLVSDREQDQYTIATASKEYLLNSEPNESQL
ncbi:high-affinity choline transporter 1-like [Tubulanus polymorphus]|uniref:high-affinity choline transporter 1-like n=1 Tax=Tubulanus polymorphus TaxID=672921 RepID=UPI003DA2D4BD